MGKLRFSILPIFNKSHFMHPFESDFELSKNLIALLFKLSKKDQGTGSVERSYIDYVANQLGVEDYQVKEIEAEYEKFDMQIPENEMQRMSILYYLLFLIKIDSDVSEKEIKLVKEFGFKLGFRARLVDELTSLMKEHEGGKVPQEAMLEKIKKYQN